MYIFIYTYIYISYQYRAQVLAASTFQAHLILNSAPMCMFARECVNVQEFSYLCLRSRAWLLASAVYASALCARAYAHFPCVVWQRKNQQNQTRTTPTSLSSTHTHDQTLLSTDYIPLNILTTSSFPNNSTTPPSIVSLMTKCAMTLSFIFYFTYNL